MKQQHLALEDNPVVSHYLEGRSGRRAASAANHLDHQGSLTLVAHKSDKFICNGGGARGTREEQNARRKAARLEPPRQPELEEIGVVMSNKRPEVGTFLAPSTADFLLKR